MSTLKSLIGIINLSTKVSNDDAKIMTIACQEQINNDVAPNWHIEPCFVIFYDDPKTMSLRAFPVVILDSPNTPEAIGFHAEMNGKPYGRVFADTILQHGGTLFCDKMNTQNITVSSMLSKTIIESHIEKTATIWVDGPMTEYGQTYAYEPCTPVESNSYTYTIKNQIVSVSNFIFPSWFDQRNIKDSQVDFMNKSSGAFQSAKGGYMIIRTLPGQEYIMFNDFRMPDWVYDMTKYIGGRNNRRLANICAKQKPWWKHLF